MDLAEISLKYAKTLIIPTVYITTFQNETDSQYVTQINISLIGVLSIGVYAIKP